MSASARCRKLHLEISAWRERRVFLARRSRYLAVPFRREELDVRVVIRRGLMRSTNTDEVFKYLLRVEVGSACGE